MKKIYYLAHPVRGDEHYEETENLRHALRIQEILWNLGIYTTMPWYSYILIWPEFRDEEAIKRFLTFDCVCVQRCDGIILTGHKLSKGMQLERLAAIDAGLEIINLIYVPDKDLASYLTVGLNLGGTHGSAVSP